MVRFKNRYLLAELRWHDGRVDDTLQDAALLGLLRQGVALNFGDVSAGAALASMVWLRRVGIQGCHTTP
jgi:ribonuclease P/MRP protein subunit POP5